MRIGVGLEWQAKKLWNLFYFQRLMLSIDKTFTIVIAVISD